jgi:hypothetical protein
MLHLPGPLVLCMQRQRIVRKTNLSVSTRLQHSARDGRHVMRLQVAKDVIEIYNRIVRYTCLIGRDMISETFGSRRFPNTGNTCY